ncbi:MAG: hypothetical protein ACT4OS_07155 [Acidimicrobiales bacterium]
MDRTRRSVDAYLRRLVEADRAVMASVDRVLVEAMPGAARRLWVGTFWGGTDQEIIGYGDLVQPRPKGDPVDWFVVGLARQRRHFSLYVNAVEDGRYLAHHYADRLGKVRVGSASITFRGAGDLDLDTLAVLASHSHRLTSGDGATDAPRDGP